MSLSVIVITRNEEANIRDCLESVRWADEIVVVDSGSSDSTCEIAREFTEKVFEEKWQGYAANKNLGLNRAEGKWVLWVDADERVTPELGQEIRDVLAAQPQADGFEMPRLAFFMGRWIKHCGWYPGHVLRLFRRVKGRFTDDLVHEGVVLEGTRGRLKNPLLHYTDLTLDHYLEKLNVYTTLAARTLIEGGKTAGCLQMLLRPTHTFLRMFIIRLGFLDGIQGLMLSLLSAGHVFVKYAKVWEQTQSRSNRCLID